MTELRDARLRKAMDEAPDAQLRPQARTREAIRDAAHAALQPAWKRWWAGAGRSGTPWAAAFATIALATLVTVLWQDEEVPGARSEMQVATAPETVPSPPPPPAPPSVPAPSPAPAAAPAPAPAPTAVAPTPAAPPVALQDRAAVRQRMERLPPSGAADAGRSASREDRAVAAAPPPAAAPAPSAPPPAPAGMAPAATPPALASAGPQRQAAAAAPSAPSPTLRAGPAALPWTQVRIEAGGRSVVVPRMQAQELPALVTSMLGSPSEDADPPVGQAVLRLELAQGDEPAGVLELVGEQWRWTSLREARGPRLLRPEAELASALRRQVEALLPN